jgi:hypothetical protein
MNENKGWVYIIIFVSFSIILSLCFSIYSETLDLVNTDFSNFQSKFGKSYGSLEEFEMRKSIFSKNLLYISENENLEINDFSDWTDSEI